MLRKQTPAWAT